MITQETADKLNELVAKTIQNLSGDFAQIATQLQESEEIGEGLLESLRIDEERRRVCTEVLQDLQKSKELFADNKIDESAAIIDRCIIRLRAKVE